MVTDVTIISEIGRLKEEAGMVQGEMARPDKRRGVRSEDNILSFQEFGDNCRSWPNTEQNLGCPCGPQSGTMASW